VIATRRELRSWRVAIGLVVLALWAGGLAFLARRELLKPMSARLVEAALQVQPSSHYYVILRDDAPIGGATAEVDTTGYGIVFRQHVFGQLLEGDSSDVVIRARSSYTPGLAFGAFRMAVERGADSVVMTGQRTEDSVLIVTTETGGTTGPRRRLSAGDPLFLPPVAALPVVLLNRPRRGLQADVHIFDPLRQRVRTLPLTVARESVFVVPDSAAFDTTARRWLPARYDTVMAWLIASDSTSIRAWVDRSGRIVFASDGHGTRAERTAYEIAYENWRLSRGQRSEP
jgi:hypothetical protein